MSDITWESLRPELQTALRTLAEGRRIDSALENELEDLGLAEYVQGAHATWATDKGYALLPAGEAVEITFDPLPDLNEEAFGSEMAMRRALAEWSHAAAEDTEAELKSIMTPEEYAWYKREMASPIVETTNTANIVASLQADLAAALARAQAAEERVERTCAALTSIFVECIYVSDHGGSATEAIESIVVKARDALK